jgi:quinol-cytochrome oxidoreductase complex cytochrome b subunit
MSKTFWHHLLPPRVSEYALRFGATGALGVVAVSLLAWTMASGVLLSFAYVPEPEQAYQSVLAIQFGSSSGALLRGLHRFGAHASLVVVGLHLARIMFWGAYTASRRLNQWLGLALFAVLLGFSFTGYLLPWDQQSVWGVAVVASALESLPLLGEGAKTLLLGGAQVGAPTLHRFYGLHTALLPGLLLVGLVLHLWRLRRDGGLLKPELPSAKRFLPARPHLSQRIFIVFALSSVGLLLAAGLFDAPMGAPAKLWRPDNPEKAAWYLLWLQEAASVSTTAAQALCALLVLGLAGLPLLDRAQLGDQGKRPTSQVFAGRRWGLFSALAAVLLFVLVLSSAFAGWHALWPALILLALAPVLVRLLARQWRAGVVLWMALAMALLLALTVLGALRVQDWQLPSWGGGDAEAGD